MSRKSPHTADSGPRPELGFGLTGPSERTATARDIDRLYSLLDVLTFGIPQTYAKAHLSTRVIEDMVGFSYSEYAAHTTGPVVAAQTAVIDELRGPTREHPERRLDDTRVIERLNIWLEAVMNANGARGRIREIAFWSSAAIGGGGLLFNYLSHIERIIRSEGQYCFGSPRYGAGSGVR